MSKIRDLTYVAFDLEATYSKSLSRHEIIEIGAHRLEPGTLDIVDSFETLVRPFCRIIWPIKQKTGITDEMVREANPINEVWEDFTAFVGNAILVAHQASLDMNILRKSAEHYKLAPLTNPVLDTLRLAKRLYPEEVSYGLSHFQALLGLTAVEHRASADAHVTAFLFKHLVQILEDRHGVSEYQQLWDFCYGEKPLQMKLF